MRRLAAEDLCATFAAIRTIKTRAAYSREASFCVFCVFRGHHFEFRRRMAAKHIP
jgi:hypothetical protein